MRRILVGLPLLWCAFACGQAAELLVQPEYLRTAPSGEIVAADRDAAGHALTSPIAGARLGYVSLQVIARPSSPGGYTLELTPPSGLQVDVFREWYHLLEKEKTYYPDALAPVRLPYHSLLPEPDNRIAGQKAQAFWVDVWIPLKSMGVQTYDLGGINEVTHPGTTQFKLGLCGKRGRTPKYLGEFEVCEKWASRLVVGGTDRFRQALLWLQQFCEDHWHSPSESEPPSE